MKIAMKLCLFALGMTATTAPAAVRYTITELDSGTWHKINDAGQIIGWDSYPNSQPFIWSETGGKHRLPDLPGGTVDGVAVGLNNAGDVVGSSSGSNGYRATLWTQAGVLDLGLLTGGFSGSSSASAINASRQVVGESISETGLNAFMWSQADGMRNLGGLMPGGSSRAVAINDGGTVAGNAAVSGGSHAFVWTDATGMRDLGQLPDGVGNTDARAINAGGQIVGAADTLYGFRGYRWSSDTGMVALNPLGGGGSSSAVDINDAGEVIGNSSFENDPLRPVLWNAAGVAIDLNSRVDSTSDWVLRFVTSINNRGQIVGVGHRDEQLTSFLLTPYESASGPAGVPEPSSWAMLIVGFGLTGCTMRRRRVSVAA